MRRCALLLFLASASAFASDRAPVVGLLYNTKESNSLEYECRQLDVDHLVCKFIQTRVVKSESAAALEKDKAALGKEFEQMSADEIRQSCETLKEFRDILNGRKPAPPGFEKDAVLQNSVARDYYFELSAAGERFCNEPSKGHFAMFAGLSLEREARTCRVSSMTFEQEFRPLVSNDGPPVWIVRSDPQGPCGAVQLSRFERVNTNSGLGFWVYHARKAITNPRAEVMPGMSCDELDEEEYLFDWKRRELPMGCDFIEFSVL